jgi:hypothetical protein
VREPSGVHSNVPRRRFLAKLGKTHRRRFYVLHNAVDTDTLRIHATRVRTRLGGDAKEMISLLRRVLHPWLENIYGDKGCISRRNVQYIHEIGAYPAIELRKNLSFRSRGHRAYGRLIGEYRRDPAGWKKRPDYGRRSLVETVFSMMKLIYRGSFSSRGWMKQRRELLIKVALHNIERLNYLECAGK